MDIRIVGIKAEISQNVYNASGKLWKIKLRDIFLVAWLEATIIYSFNWLQICHSCLWCCWLPSAWYNGIFRTSSNTICDTNDSVMRGNMLDIPWNLQLVQVFCSINHSTNLKIVHQHYYLLTSNLFFDTQQQ